MDGSKKVMETLDSLWFFNNVLALPSFQHKVHGASLYEEDTLEEEEEQSKPNIQDAPSTEILVLKCAEVEQQPITESELLKPTEERKRRRRRRRRSKRSVLGELDLGFHAKFSEENIAHPNFETTLYTKMPPLNDGFAMKQHLKSWAYAAACTIK